MGGGGIVQNDTWREPRGQGLQRLAGFPPSRGRVNVIPNLRGRIPACLSHDHRPLHTASHVLLIALATLASLATIAVLFSVLRAVRAHEPPAPVTHVRHERRRAHPAARDAREAIALVGDALAATHNPRALVPLILEVVTEATGARGAQMLHGGVELGWFGEAGGRTRPLTLDLASENSDSDTKLLLYPPARGFDVETQKLAQWVAAQAGIALENARLHEEVRRQATHDALAATRMAVSHDATVRLSASFGIAESSPALTTDELLRRADDALYAAKRAGKNRYVVDETAGVS